MMSEQKFKWVALISTVPVLMWPLLLAHVDKMDTAIERFLMLGMPVFALLCGYLANYTYKDRPEVAWILIGLAWLSYAGFLILGL